MSDYYNNMNDFNGGDNPPEKQNTNSNANKR